MWFYLMTVFSLFVLSSVHRKKQNRDVATQTEMVVLHQSTQTWDDMSDTLSDGCFRLSDIDSDFFSEISVNASSEFA